MLHTPKKSPFVSTHLLKTRGQALLSSHRVEIHGSSQKSVSG